MHEKSTSFDPKTLKNYGVEIAKEYGKVGKSYDNLAMVALTLRIGVGALFVAGGWNKLSKLMSSGASDKLVASYFTVTVTDTDQLDEVLASLKKVKQVQQVQRIS